MEFDRDFILDWRAQAGEVALSGDPGYSRGVSTGISRATRSRRSGASI